MLKKRKIINNRKDKIHLLLLKDKSNKYFNNIYRNREWLILTK